MFSMCQKLFKALSMYSLLRDHIISGVDSKPGSQTPESDVFCIPLPPWSGFQILF